MCETFCKLIASLHHLNFTFFNKNYISKLLMGERGGEVVIFLQVIKKGNFLVKGKQGGRSILCKFVFLQNR